MVQGGYYLKGFAKHGPLHNPHTYGYFGPIAYQGRSTAATSLRGASSTRAMPSRRHSGARSSAAICSRTPSTGTCSTTTGSTFSGRHGGTLIDARDRWFRPIDLLTGPDAAVYVVDWYDKRAAHLDPRDTWDRTNGRIYRVVYGERRRVPAFDLAKRSSAELVGLRNSTNDWFAAEARRILAERHDPRSFPP